MLVPNIPQVITTEHRPQSLPDLPVLALSIADRKSQNIGGSRRPRNPRTFTFLAGLRVPHFAIGEIRSVEQHVAHLVDLRTVAMPRIGLQVFEHRLTVITTLRSELFPQPQHRNPSPIHQARRSRCDQGVFWNRLFLGAEGPQGGMMPRRKISPRMGTLRIARIKPLGPEKRPVIIIQETELSSGVNDVRPRIKEGEVPLDDTYHRIGDGLVPDGFLIQLLHVAPVPGEVHEAPVLNVRVPVCGHHPTGCNRIRLPEKGVIGIIAFHLMAAFPSRPVVAVLIIGIQVHPAMMPHLEQSIGNCIMPEAVAKTLLVGLLVARITSQVTDPNEKTHEISLISKIRGDHRLERLLRAGARTPETMDIHLLRRLHSAHFKRVNE